MAVAVFMFGLLAGSFLNAVIWRLREGRSIFERRSVCPHCKHQLASADLVPVLSFLRLRGRCRYCGKRISWQYPLVELATAFGFVLIYTNSVIPAQAGIQALFFCFLVVIFVYDLKHYLILDKVVFPAAALALLYQGYRGNWGNALIGAAALAGFFAFLYLVSRGKWIGLGDIKLGIFLGLLVPWPQTVVLFFLAYFLGAAVSVPLLLIKQKRLRDRLPFGTFLTSAAFIAMLYGESISRWYLRLIGMA